MSHHSSTDVLVAGAGPVGMLTALLLAQAGVRVTLIDREQRIATHSYACGLHPRSLRLLARVGVLNDILGEARRIEKVAFYSGQHRQAEVKLSSLPVEFPYVLVLPQSTLESLLMQRLKQTGCEILWHHRLSTLQQQGDSVQVEVDQLVGTTTGYIVPHWEWVVRRTLQINASFLVGADGQRSIVRRLLGIEREQFGEPEFYVVYEFEAGSAQPDELRVVADRDTQSVLWPLADGRCRWSFQLANVQASTEFSDKDRNTAWAESQSVAERTVSRLKTRLAERAPWFTADVRKVDWAVDIQFQRWVAKKFGEGRCWLAGDAAHQTSPAGIQSMNAGLIEAKALAGSLVQILHQGSKLGLLAEYNRVQQESWQRLLGANGNPKPNPGASVWARENAGKVVSALPATGNELAMLLAQLGLAWE